MNDLEIFLVEDKFSLLVVLCGSLLISSLDGLLIFVGGKIIDYCKMVVGVMVLIVKILVDKYDVYFNEINLKNFFVFGGDIDLYNVDVMIVFYVK